MSGRASRLLLGVTAAFALLGVGNALAATATVNFDDRANNDRLSTEYHDSQGVSFTTSGDSYLPLVKAAPAAAHSPNNLAIYSCEGIQGCGEGFSTPRIRGVLKTSGTSVSAYVGYYSGTSSGDSMKVRIVGYDADGNQTAASDYVTVTDGSALTQQVTATAPSGKVIDYFELVADAVGDMSAGKAMAFDDITVVTPDAPPPPNFTLNDGLTVADVLTGTSVDIPIDLNRINGSNGDITFAVSGLPTGMTASISPNPVTGTNTTTTLTLTAAAGAAHSDQYTQITVTATPSAGAGSTARSITKQVRIRENCDRTVRFDYVDARADGCMVRSNGKLLATNEAVRINGLIIKPADDSMPTLVIDPQAKTIKSQDLTRPFLVAIDSSPEIPIWVGPIDWSFTGTGTAPRKVVHYDASTIKKLKGIPVTGLDVSFTQSGKSQITPTLNLAFWPFNALFGGVTTSTQFTTDNDHGADFTGLDIKLADVNAVALELKDVELHWHEGSGGESWSGSAKVVLKFGTPYTVGAGFGIKNGSFDFLQGSVGGLNVSIGPGVFLQSIGFEVHVNPLVLAGSVGISAGPSIAGKSAVTVDGTLKATFGDPFVVEVDGGVKVADRYDIGKAFLRYSSTGLFEFGGEVHFNYWQLAITGNVTGWVSGLDAFNVDGSVKACLDIWGPDPCGDARLVVSSKGIGGCIGVFGYHVGAGTTWDPFDPDAFTGCDLSPYTETKPRGTGTQTRFALPKGLPSVAWQVIGDGTVPGPGVTITGPGGRTATVTKDAPLVTHDGIRAELLGDGTTFVLVRRPAAGTWTVTGDGSVPISRIREARGLPAPRIRATVTGHGRRRMLGWRMNRIKGETVTFAEVGKDVRKVIVTNVAANGSRPFRPADGPAGRRRIVALVAQDGLPRRTIVVGSYRAPGTLRPGKPRRLRVVRRGTRLVVSFRPHPAGFRHAVYVRLTDGRRLLRVVAPKRRSVTITGVAASVGGRVAVRDLSRGNAPGPIARTRIGTKNP